MDRPVDRERCERDLGRISHHPGRYGWIAWRKRASPVSAKIPNEIRLLWGELLVPKNESGEFIFALQKNDMTVGNVDRTRLAASRVFATSSGQRSDKDNESEMAHTHNA